MHALASFVSRLGLQRHRNRPSGVTHNIYAKAPFSAMRGSWGFDPGGANQTIVTMSCRTRLRSLVRLALDCMKACHEKGAETLASE